MGNLLVPLLLFVLVGGLASVWLFKVRERREQVSTGLMALSAMHWRELQRLVVAAMHQRGYQPHRTAEAREEDGLVALARKDETWLLSTKHGTAYVLGTAAVGEFANAMQLLGAQGGVMATVGDIGEDTRSLARRQRIEVLDGATLWSEVAPLLESQQRRIILGEVHARTRRHAMLAWMAAAAIAVLAFVSLPKVPSGASNEANGVTAPYAASAPNAGTKATPAAAPAAIPEDPAQLALRRTHLARAVGTLPWVARATWSTASTLLIELQGDAPAEKDALCKLVESYPELRASRLQLQTPAGSGQPVRFMQCRVY